MELARQITPNNIGQLSNTTDKAMNTLIDKIVEAKKKMREKS